MIVIVLNVQWQILQTKGRDHIKNTCKRIASVLLLDKGDILRVQFEKWATISYSRLAADPQRDIIAKLEIEYTIYTTIIYRSL